MTMAGGGRNLRPGRGGNDVATEGIMDRVCRFASWEQSQVEVLKAEVEDRLDELDICVVYCSVEEQA